MSQDKSSPTEARNPVDEAREVRAGEGLDEARLAGYLAQVLPQGAAGAAADRGGAGGESSSLRVRQFPGGFSNLTYLVSYAGRDYVLRRPPFGSKVKSAHDMGREFGILSRLHPHYPAAPRPVCFCEDESVIGAKFYLMERIAGLILRREIPADSASQFAPARMHALCDRFVDTLVDLHALDYQAIGLSDVGRPEGYVERQVSGWSRRYRDAQTDDVPALDHMMGWLAAHLPTSPAPTLIHNDYKFDNLVLDPADPTRVIGLLDWEMATIGDPLMDLGTALCYWVDADDPVELQATRMGPTNQPGCLTRREIAARYATRSGRDLRDIVFYYCFGLFKTAVVVQQIYYRYRQGLTQDRRFATLGAMAALLGQQAQRFSERDTL